MLTDDQTDLVFDLAAQGLTQLAIARRLGVSLSTINRALHRGEVATVHRHRDEDEGPRFEEEAHGTQFKLADAYPHLTPSEKAEFAHLASGWRALRLRIAARLLWERTTNRTEVMEPRLRPFAGSLHPLVTNGEPTGDDGATPRGAR